MAGNEGHIHWSGVADEVIEYLGQELRLTSEISNMVTEKVDPIGTIRIGPSGDATPGLAIPTEGWEVIPGTSPVLEARADGHYSVGYIRLRLA